DGADHWAIVPSEGSNYRIRGLKPGKVRVLSFLDEKKRLAGELTLHGDETTPQRVTLQPWGTLVGRVVDADGEPLGEGFLYPVRFPSSFPKVGKDGRFRVEGLVAGKSYRFDLLSNAGRRFGGNVTMDVKVGAGEIKDLGDVVPRSPKRQ